MAERETIEWAIKRSWSAFTTFHRGYHPHKSPERERLGQSGPTALVLQDFLGGRIMASTVTLPTGERMTHYHNEVDGEVIDLTRTQYGFYEEPVTFQPACEVDRSVFDATHPESMLHSVLKRQVELVLAEV